MSYAFSYVVLHRMVSASIFTTRRYIIKFILTFSLPVWDSQSLFLTRYLGTLLGFQNYELLDFILQCDLFSSIVQLKIKHWLLHNCSFDDHTSMKILDPQRHTVNIRDSHIHQRKLLLHFLIHLKKRHVTFVEYSWSIQGIFLHSIFLEHYFGIPGIIQETFFQISREYIMGMLHEYSTNIYLPGDQYTI